MSDTILGKLSGGPLGGQTLPLSATTLAEVDDELILPWEQLSLIHI